MYFRKVDVIEINSLKQNTLSKSVKITFFKVPNVKK